MSCYFSTKGCTCKPFNPLFGETYEVDYPDIGVRFFFEKDFVSAHTIGLGYYARRCYKSTFPTWFQYEKGFNRCKGC